MATGCNRFYHNIQWYLAIGLIAIPSIIGLICIRPVYTAYAQVVSPCTQPQSLSRGIMDMDGNPANSYMPTLVADSEGYIHAVWMTRITTEIQGIYNALYYSRWDGLTWSTPVNIFYSTSSGYWMPQAATGPGDQIHLAFVNGGVLWYSHVLAREADQVKAWSTPIRLSDYGVTNASIAVSRDGVIRIAYTHFVGVKKEIYYLFSSDGENWSLPEDILDVKSQTNDIISRIAVDENERIHVVIGETYFGGNAVYYLRSSDSGKTWSPPLVVDQQDSRYKSPYTPSLISVITRGKDEVHLIWDGAPMGQRWHQWSDDGGKTWKQAVQLSADVRGLTGTNAMAFDKTGRLYLFTMGLKGTAPYYATWLDGTWSALTPLAPGSWNGEEPGIAFSGDKMVVAWWNNNVQDDPPSVLDVASSTCTINAPPLLIQNTEIPSVEITQTPEMIAPQQPTITPTVQVVKDSEAFPSKSLPNETGSPLTIGFVFGSLPAVVLIAFILLIRRKGI